MLYLASVQRNRIQRSVALKLLAVKRVDGLWRKLPSDELIVVPPSVTDLADERLVVVSLSLKREVVNIVSATSAMPLILQQLSGEIFKLKKSEEEIEAWKMSLQYQSAELSDRREALEAGEESLKVRLELFDKEKDKLERDAEAAAAQRIALQSAMEAVRLEQKRLKDI